jgi:MOSC domain-containing protein YiiM
MNGIIERIKIYTAKGEAGKEMPEARLIENLGLEGDRHAKGGERQISLLLSECRDQITNEKETGLCLARFKENLSIRFLDTAAIKPGIRLEIGEAGKQAVLEITGEIKRCFDECALYQAGKPCPLAGQNLFAKVLKGGVIRVGDGVSLINK